MSKFSSIIAVCVITFTSFLVTKTLQIQHSCNPMLHSGTLPIQCQVAANNFNSKSEKSSLQKPTNSKPSTNNLQQVEQPKIAQKIGKERSPSDSQISNPEISPNNIESQPEQSNPVTKLVKIVNEHPDDVIGGVAGVAGGIATVAAAGATAALSVPVAGAVLIGLGIWFAIRTVF
jgi:hypothetical protein